MIRVNGVERAFVQGTIEQLVAAMDIEPRGVAVAIDGEIVRRSQWDSTYVSDECAIEIVSAVAGG